jgi:hypothetical protein
VGVIRFCGPFEASPARLAGGTDVQASTQVLFPEFKAQAVDLVHQSGKGIQQIAKDLDLTETCLREDTP